LNSYYLKELPADKLGKMLGELLPVKDEKQLTRIATLVNGRAKTLSGLAKEASIVVDKPTISLDTLAELTNDHIWGQIGEILGGLPFSNWTISELEALFKSHTLSSVTSTALRYLLTGKTSAPNLVALCHALGKNETINRLRKCDPLYIAWKYK
jgi:glutamyl/glutaminyl-tRNA synthetase